MLRELETPARLWRERHGHIQDAFVRAIDPLITQSYNSLRMAIECMELRDLLAAEAGAASEWVNSDLTGQLTTESAPLVDVAPAVSLRDLLEAVRECAGAVVEGAGLIEDELQSFDASGAQPVIERHGKIRDELSVALTVLDDHRGD
jgi:hypothetical protein